MRACTVTWGCLVLLGCGGPIAGQGPGGMATGPAASPGPGQASGMPVSGTLDMDKMLSGPIGITDNLVVAAGMTLTFAPGAMVHVAAGKSITVQGTLVAQGTSGAPIVFQSEAHHGPGEWSGILVKSGGTLNLGYAELHNADDALQIGGNSHAMIDHVTIDSTNVWAQIDADITISRSTFHGLGMMQQGSPLLIAEASPQISNSLFDRANPLIDMIVVDGAASAPTFDHVEVTQAHCAFHATQGTNVTIENSFVHGNAYGIMIESSQNTKIRTSNFQNNSVEIGQCLASGSVQATGNYFDAAPFDSTCAHQSNASAAGGPVPGAGVQP